MCTTESLWSEGSIRSEAVKFVELPGGKGSGNYSEGIRVVRQIAEKLYCLPTDIHLFDRATCFTYQVHPKSNPVASGALLSFEYRQGS